jgi:hypothetical protein
MALVFAGIDPDTGGDNCPAVFIDDETGDLIFQGWTVTDPKMLADVVKHSRLVRFGYFAGDGEFLEHELADDPAVVRLCATAFEAVWERAIPHAEYRPA